MHPIIWINFKCIMLSGRCQTQVVIYTYALIHFYNIAKAKLSEEKNQRLPVLGLGEGGITRKMKIGE